MKNNQYLTILTCMIILFMSCKNDEKIILDGTLGVFESTTTLNRNGEVFSCTFNYRDTSMLSKNII